MLMSWTEINFFKLKLRRANNLDFTVILSEFFSPNLSIFIMYLTGSLVTLFSLDKILSKKASVFHILSFLLSFYTNFKTRSILGNHAISFISSRTSCIIKFEKSHFDFIYWHEDFTFLTSELILNVPHALSFFLFF